MKELKPTLRKDTLEVHGKSAQIKLAVLWSSTDYEHDETIVSIEQAIVENLRVLPPEKQQEVLDFIEFLKAKSRLKVDRRSIKGICADLGVHITEEEIAEARQEMWGNFPGKDF